MVDLIRQFSEDPTVLLILILIGLRLVLGVSAALKNDAQHFRLSYVADILRVDVLGKVIPYFGLWSAVQIGGDLELGELELIEESVGVLVIAALSGAILNSLRDLGLFKSAPDTIAGPDPTTPL